MDGQCFDTLVSMAPTDIALGLILGPIGTPASWIPQHLKMLRLKSCDGMSSTTFVGLLFTFSCAVSNALILHWRQIRLCGGGGGNELACQPSLLSMYQLVAMLVCVAPFPFYFLLYGADKGSREHRALRRRVVVTCTFGATVLAIAIGASMAEPCTPWLTSFANVLGLAAALSSAVQWAPQVLATYRAKSTGAVSLFSFSIQILGGCLLFYFQVFGSHERWSTWLPNLCGTLVQGQVFFMCCYYSYFRDHYIALEQQGRGEACGDECECGVAEGGGDGGGGDFVRLDEDSDGADGSVKSRAPMILRRALTGPGAVKAADLTKADDPLLRGPSY